MSDEKPQIDLPDPFGLGGVEFQTPDEPLTPQKMGALEQHLERAGWLNLQEVRVLLATIRARDERIKDLEQSRQDLVKAAFATVQERDQLRRELKEVYDMLNPEWRGKFTLKELVKENIDSWHFQARELAELKAAINPDGSLTEHQQFVETAQDGAHALDRFAEIDSELAERDELLVTFRTMEASLGTLDHSEAVEECDLAASVEKKVFTLLRELAEARADKERLDWCEENMEIIYPSKRPAETIREDIDVLRLAQKESL